MSMALAKHSQGIAAEEAKGSAGERSEPERTVGSSAAGRPWPPDPEVSTRPTRRTFTAEYKAKILAEVDSCSQPGQVGAILRREGLYSSHLGAWRKTQRQAQLEHLRRKSRGPKASSSSVDKEELTKLKRENAKLLKKLRQAELVIDFQKKVSEMLGLVLPPQELDETEQLD